MIEFILSVLAIIRVFLRSRCRTALEILALRQQVAVLKRKRPRPPLNAIDRLERVSPPLVALEWGSHHRQARDGRRLAPRRLPPLLALAFPPA